MIAEASLNHASVTNLTFRGYQALKYITFGPNCCANVQSVSFSQMPSLLCINIESYCFRSNNGDTLSIFNCSKLGTVLVGKGCFIFFKDFSTSNLPSLSTLFVGSVEPSEEQFGCFYFAPRFNLSSGCDDCE